MAITPTVIGQRAFHLEEITFVNTEQAQLKVLYRDDNGTVDETVEYPIPQGFREVIEALRDACPLHMIGFQEQDGQMYLADARTVWGYSCPCND